jgi:ferrochelatase
MNKAIVFLNMGAPRDLDEVEVFLKNMFNDKNIITVKSNLLRKYIASKIVSAHKEGAKSNYKKLGGFSPLVKHTKTLLENIKKEFPEFEVINIMRYTPEFALPQVKWLKAKGVKDIILIPLYAQYSTTTTKSSIDDFHQALEEAKYLPNLKIIARFYKNKNYNKAIVEQIELALKDKNSKEFDLIFSAHSLPEKIIKDGDSYEKEIVENVDILKDILNKKGIDFNSIHLAYQSKVGDQKWLEPSLEDKLKDLNRDKVIIYPISFILDNSETEFELEMEYREVANELGYKEYIVANCLNDSRLFIETIKELVN